MSIKMASPSSPQTLTDKGARDALTAALEEHSKNPDIALSRYQLGTAASGSTSVAGSEPPSRGESTDGDATLEDRMNTVRDGMEVFVDPGETDGLPSVSKTQAEAKTAKQAWGLVRSYQSGTSGFMRHRKNAGFKSGMGEGRTASETEGKDDESKLEEKSTRDSQATVQDADKEEGDVDVRATGNEEGAGKISGFFKRLRSNDLMIDQAGDSLPRGAAPANNGILSALIALQQQQQNNSGSTSNLTSTASSPLSSGAPSRRGSDDEDSDEESERRKFTERQRAKRAKGSWLDSSSNTVAGIGKSALGASHVLGFSSKDKEQHHKKNGSSVETTSNPTTTPHSAEPTPKSNDALMSFIGSRSTSHLPDGLASPPGGVPIIGPVAHRRKKTVLDQAGQRLKHLGQTIGFELETSQSRPSAARSAGGVFGGLMLATGNIAGAATPAATKLAPQASRPGYHLSRYSAPDVKTSRPRSLNETSSRPESRHSSRPSTPGESRDELESPKTGRTLFGSRPSSAYGPPTPPPHDLGPRSQTGLSDKSTKHKSAFSLSLPHTPFSFHSRPPSVDYSPRKEGGGDYFAGHKETQEEREKREWEKEKRRRKKLRDKRKQEEVFITMHVAAILSRQDFIMKMGRSFMMFGAPSHRLEAQIQATARVLEINCQVIYIPGVMLISFGDNATHTSEIKFLKQANGLDLGKLLEAYYIYWRVIHDKVSVTDAAVELDTLMLAPPEYKLWQNMIIGGLASAFIQASAFYGSFIDCLVSIPLGALLVLVQVVVSRNDLYSSLFEIVIACINSFLAAALASTGQFCFAAVASGSVVLILPGYIVLCGSLELANRSIISGSVRLVYSILYSLFLGFGLAMGGEVYSRITGLAISGGQDYQCTTLRLAAPWWRATIPAWWYFLTIPAYLLMLGLRNGQPLWRKETLIMLIIGSAGFSANFFSGKAFVNRADISSALGSFTVGFLGNVYGKFTKGSPFVVMVVGVLIQLPSGLSNNGGLLAFASSTSSTASYSAGFTTAENLVEIAVGLVVGLFISAAIVNFAGGGRRRGSNLSSF